MTIARDRTIVLGKPTAGDEELKVDFAGAGSAKGAAINRKNVTGLRAGTPHEPAQRSKPEITVQNKSCAIGSG